MPEAVCPLCRSAALTIPLSNSTWRFTCPTCGRFELGDFGFTGLGSQQRWDEMRLELSTAARKASDEGHPLKVTDEESLLQAIAMSHVGTYS